MQANELRLGNILKGGVVDEFSEKLVHFEGVRMRKKVFGFIHPNCRPVKLSEKKFEELGFVKDELGYWSKGDSIYSFVDRGELGYMLVIADIEYKETYIKYVHKLQNLYFALTGEELSVK